MREGHWTDHGEYGSRRRARGRGSWDWGPWAAGMFGAGGPPPFGPPYGGRGPRARRGDVRAAVLVLLAEEPRNGYQLIQEIGRRTDGMWRPSPGSIYPALQLLEDEGLVRSREAGSGRLFELTDAGREYVATQGGELRDAFEQFSGAGAMGGEDMADLVGALKPIGMALVQIMHNGSPKQVQEAAKVLAKTRRSLYEVLAEEDAE